MNFYNAFSGNLTTKPTIIAERQLSNPDYSQKNMFVVPFHNSIWMYCNITGDQIAVKFFFRRFRHMLGTEKLNVKKKNEKGLQGNIDMLGGQ